MLYKTLYALLICAAATTVMTSCNKNRSSDTSTSGTEVIACDESFQKIMEQEINVFEYNNPKAYILPRYIPESDCIDSIVNCKVRVAVTTRELTQAEIDRIKAQRRTPQSTRIAVDAIAVIANPENPVEELTIPDLKKILSGEISQWDKVEPYNKSGKINIVFDYARSSTVSSIKRDVMQGQEFGDNVFAQNSNAKVFETVSKMKGALGIIGVSWVSSDLSKAELSTEELSRTLERNDTTVTTFATDVKVLAIAPEGKLKGVKPYQAYIYDGSYPLVRSVYITTTGVGGSLALGFTNFIRSFQGQKLIQQTGVLPGTMQPRMVQIE